MLKKIVWGIVIIVMLGVIALYFIKPGSVFSSDNIFTNLMGKSETSETDKPESEKDVSDAGVNAKPQEVLGDSRIPDSNMFAMSDSVVTDGLEYRVDSCRVTKEKGDFTIESYMKWTKEAQADENGNLAGPYSYVILNLTVTNIGDAVDEVSLMNLGLQIRDQSGKSKYEVDGVMAEVRTFSGLDSGKGMGAARFSLEPGESYEGELAYIETDEMLHDSKLELIIDPGSNLAMGDYQNIRGIRLN